MPASATTYLFSWWVLLLSCAGCTSLPPTAASSFKKGNEQLAKGDYAHAIGTYRALERQGVQRAELYCNTGTAFYKTGQVGWAIYYYEKGLVLAPLDAQLRANKAAALRQAEIQASTEKPIYTLSESTATKAADVVGKLAIASVLLSSVLFLGSALGKRKLAMETLLRPSRYLLLLGGGLLLVAGGLLWPFARPGAIVVQAKIIGRAGPGRAARRVFEARAGETVTVQTRYQGWLKVQTPNGEEGWVNAASVASLAH